MTSANQNPTARRLRRALVLTAALGLVATLASAGEGSPPSWEKAFAPSTIGPGSTSMLTFTIGPGAAPTEDMAFTDVLPGPVDLASPPLVFNDCGGSVTFSGGDTITFADGLLGTGETCKIVVLVTSSTDGTHMNVSEALTSNQGSSGTVSADLTVDDTLPGFSKSFSTSTVAFGGRTTLTFLIDNPLTGGFVGTLDFTDVMPTGMVVANPSNATTDCNSKSAFVPPASLSAAPGSSTIVLDADGAATAAFNILAAGESCTVEVDVIGGAVGSLGNISGNLFIDLVVEVGKAAAVLEVTGFEDPVTLVKEFTDDPVAPGGTVTLEFTITNQDRDDSATMIAFSDDLGATLAGLAPAGPLPTDPCGAGSSLSFTPGVPPSAVLALSGGTLGPESSCTFSVELAVPGTAVPGDYPNTTSAITADVGGSAESGDPAGDILFVVPFPVLTKEFTDDPVGAGGSVTLEFTITNPGAAAMTDIEFLDELTDNSGGLGVTAVGNGFLPFPVSVTIPPGDPCGAGSSLALVFVDTDRQGLSLTGGSLAANDGMPGGPDTCTFSVTVDIPEGFSGGTYTNTTEPPSATVAAATVVGPQASDTVVVAGAPSLSKEFTDDPALPSGDTVTLELTLFYDAEEGAADATAIAFSDDLKTVLPGTPDLSAASVDSNSCTGSTVDITTDPTVIAFSGGSLMAGESCTVVVTVTVPAGAPIGTFTNTTSDVASTTGGVAATGNPATDELVITPLEVTKEFTDDPVVPGQPVTLVFTLKNLGATPADDATSIVITDSLSSILPGTPDVTSSGPPSTNTCSGTESGSSTFLSYTGGSLDGGATCTIVYDLLTPAAADDGEYSNIASASATIGGMGTSLPPPVDVLTLESERIAISKEFTDDPVLPGGTVTLRLTLENLGDDAITDIELTDDLGAALSGLEATSPALMNTCGGMATLPATVFSYAGGSLAPSGSPGDTCVIELLLDVPDGPLVDLPPFINTVTDVAGKVDTTLDVFGSDSSDELLVQTLTLAKSFTDDPAVAGGSATLEFTITNLGADAVAPLAFSDDLSAVISGLTATLPPSPDPPCGLGSSLSGTSFLALTGASLAAGGSPGDSCTFSVTVTVPASATGGSFLNTTSKLFQSGLPVAAAATDFLDIEPPPTFDKAFAPDEIDVDGVSTLTFTIDNSASSVAATALAFTDTLPAPVVVAAPSGAANSCGGTLTAVSGSATITLAGGSVAAGATCTVSVDVTADMAGTYMNTSGDLTSSSGNSGPASDTLTVKAADLGLTKTDVYEPAMAATLQVYDLEVTNAGPTAAASVVLTDVLPPGTSLVAAEPAFTCTEAGGVVTCPLGDLGVGASVTVTLTVYVEPTDAPAPIENLATVGSDTTDPDPSDNAVMEMTEVIGKAGLVMLDDVDMSGFPEAAVTLEGSIEVLVKDVDSMMPLHLTEVFPDGWALAGFEGKGDELAVMAVEVATGDAEVRVIDGANGAMLSTAMVPSGFMPVSMTAIADDGSGRSLVVVGAVSTGGGSGRVFVFDCADGSLVFEWALAAAVFPVDMTAVGNFTGDSLVELAIVWINRNQGNKRMFIRQLDGTEHDKYVLPLELTPVAVETVTDCCSLTAGDELTTLGRDRLNTRTRLYTLDSVSGAFVSDTIFAIDSEPRDLRTVGQVGGSSADDVAALFRNAAGKAATRVRDVMTGSNEAFFTEPAGSVPLGIDVSSNVYLSMIDDVSVYWVSPGMMRFVTVRDGDGAFVATVPIP